jgi:hypothetical protein
MTHQDKISLLFRPFSYSSHLNKWIERMELCIENQGRYFEQRSEISVFLRKYSQRFNLRF